ncbi:Oligopeptide transporter, OPT superfamily [gamma proteobacterium HdN1]|nr:Oligopeptide transporter, OPT superfamily [gamma proteobacterium HdN1]
MNDTQELTLRGIAIGIAITLLFTAANVYFGLKAGLTFATSIPAAVISMVLLYRSHSNIRENNIVQTLASSAGTLSAVIFVLPALVMIGWWQRFPYALTAGICLLGGLLGVAWSAPLRRVLVAGSDLPYPEGVACAEVLQVGDGQQHSAEQKHNLVILLWGALLAAGFAIMQAANLLASQASVWFRTRFGLMGGGIDLSFALFAVGYLVGPAVGVAMLAGMALTLLLGIPYFSYGTEFDASAGQALRIMSGQIRYIGAGCIGIAAIWALLRLIRPLWQGIKGILKKQTDIPAQERDLPLSVIALLIFGSLPFIAWLLTGFLSETQLPYTGWLAGAALLFIVLVAFVIATVCGYMAGLIGSSNSPLSGIGILVVLAASLLLIPLRQTVPAEAHQGLIAFALIVTAIVFASATLANDNLQDLKTGQLVGATPWKQQVALMIGVIAGALVIPWVLNLLVEAYGFVGAAGADPKMALSAPQANIIASLARGVLEANLPWAPMMVGVAIGVASILVDESLRARGRFQLPPLAVGLGLYLSPMSIAMIVLGAFASAALRAKAGQRPVLMAAGMIVGESLVGILLAGVIVLTGKSQPLALLSDVPPTAFACLAFLGLLLFCERRLLRPR